MFHGRFIFFSSLLLSLFAVSSHAQSPTPEQLRMFQNLPADQQQALARQYGITLPNINNSGASQPLPTADIRTSRPDKAEQHPLNKQDQEKEPELKRFGLDLFAASPTTFAPVSDVPVPSDYRVGPNDEIIVQLFGKDNSTQRLRVNREGVINFPSLGPISVAGLSFSEVRASLMQRVQEQMIGVRSDITLGELRSMQIFVMGDAYKPGAYTVSALTTISQAIYYSGGFSESGALRNVQLKRNGQVVRTLDLYDLLLKGDSRNDERLMPGDVVWIAPVKATISIQGEVQRPAIYEIKSGETYQDVLTLSGGVTAHAYLERAIIKRPSSHGTRDVHSLDLTQRKALQQPVHNGDEITVAKRSELLQNYVQLMGDVAHAGYAEWRDNLRISDLFHSADSAFNATADLNYALVIREVNLQRDVVVYQFSLANALLNPNSADNLLLQPRDQVLVFNRLSAEDLEELLTPKDDSREIEQTQAKSLEQAQALARSEAEREQQRLSLLPNAANELDKRKADEPIFFQGQMITQEQAKALQENSRQFLLASLLVRLQQQSSYGHPAMIAEVFGEVKYPGRYPIAQHNTVQGLLAAAGGLSADAFSANAELARIESLGNTVRTEIKNIDLSAVMQGDQQANREIKPRDRLNVFEQPGIKQQNTVVLQGEVKFPGTYTLRRGETLAQLLERAGGLTEFAHPQGAIFTREALRLQEQKLLTQYAADMRREVAKKSFNVDSRVSSVISDPDKTLAFIEEATNSRALGRMVVQLDQIIDGNKSANFMLEDGDFLFIPMYRNTVSVMGEVQVGITYLLDPSLTVKDYINRAGGMKKQADDDRIFVVRADGSVFKPNTGFWFGRRGESLRPGDTIVVPVDTDYRDALNVWTAATQILYQTGVAVNALK
ncbi:SLBB domain-containing protein [Vibrio metschnikovii]|uniref:SLBB domain-containing protein n=1 Tax=Vibrio metschnikovii TaxID=28172 RepID=UPI001302B928|nr:SLBB domain-containing protein [Vibrio metschnikovii]EKO3621489.1 SLBB domain-containing protein [Vibrio metschnikovii]EKO3624878.1 SLBB domain-containing protein [Vibrio metschnikovii]EKO3704428.1 SLBB domain-containing protein [Vibrio metschnikovii]